MIPKVPRCTLDMLSQILYDKTKDGGKECRLLKIKIISNIVKRLGLSNHYKQWQGIITLIKE